MAGASVKGPTQIQCGRNEVAKNYFYRLTIL